MQLFDERKPFWKGNLHCHTTRSDGRLSPEGAKAFYRERGYDFLALTDHRLLSEQSCMENGMLLLPGIEMDYVIPNEAIHLVGVGMDESYPSDRKTNPDAQSCIDNMRAHGGRAILCHPAWSLNSTQTICSLRSLTAVEIYNSTSTYPWNAERADSSVLLDIAAARGAIINYVASDDSHAYAGEAGRSATMVQADELTQQSLLDALDKGHFYCTQGPHFKQITVTNDDVMVSCSPVSHIIFASNLIWSFDRCASGEGLTEGRYRLRTQPGESFVRVQLVDAQGNSAWSNPIKL